MKKAIFYLMTAALLWTACDDDKCENDSDIQVRLTESKVTLMLGGTATVGAIVEPAGVSDIVWSSSNEQIATVNRFGGITAKAQGTASIIATTVVGRKVATCAVYVNPIPVTRVTVDKAALYLVNGDKATLAATVLPANATNKTVTWSTSDTKVVTVSATGAVDAVGWGNATITATTQDGGFTAICLVTVSKISVNGISVSPTNYANYSGESTTLVATVIPDNATFKGIVWSSSNDSVAKVSNNGLVTIVGEVGGKKCLIRATSEDNPAVFAECTVEVLPETAEEKLARMLHGITSKTWTWNESLGARCYGMGDAFESAPSWWNPAIPGTTDRFGASMTFTKTGLTLVKDRTDGSKVSGTFVFDPAGKNPNWRISVGKLTTAGVTILGGSDYNNVATYEFQVTKLTATDMVLAKLMEAEGFNPNVEGWGTTCLWVFKVK